MCNWTTRRRVGAGVASATYIIVVLAVSLPGQNVAAQTVSQLDWRHIGNAQIDFGLAGLATGPVARAAYSADGTALVIRTASEESFVTQDFETWKPTQAPPAAPEAASALALPESSAQLRQADGSQRLYAFGNFVYRSDDGGQTWENLTAFRSVSIIGSNVHDLTVSPKNPDEIVAVDDAGVFRSLDGGRSWSGLNGSLPNLSMVRFRNLPSADQGVEVELPGATTVEWQPGEKLAWRPIDGGQAQTDASLRQVLSPILGANVTAVAISGEYIYAGLAGPRLAASSDGGRNWQYFAIQDSGPVENFWINPKDPRLALAVLGSRPSDSASVAPPQHVIRTITGGRYWDDLTSNLGDIAAHGVTADLASGALYLATDQGVFYASADLQTGASPQWTAVTGLPNRHVADVRLDSEGNQLWAAVEGYGVYATLAPHRLKDPRVVSTADLLARAAAPGAVMSVVGARVSAASAGGVTAPVLAASDTESQIQIPFEAKGNSVSIAVNGAAGAIAFPPVALQSAAPAIFVDRDGAPMLIDVATGVMLDAMNPAHSRSHIEILATGLGRVEPDWPTGTAGPVDDPPKVVADVHAYLDGSPIDVTRAVLAPYIGFYVIEVEIPKIVNFGPAELHLEAGGQSSNHVRVYLEP